MLTSTFRDLAVAQMNDAVGHAGDIHVMGDDGRCRTQFAIDALQRLKHDNSRFGIKRSGRFVTKKHRRVFGNGAGNGHALLLAAGELGGKMIQPVG